MKKKKKTVGLALGSGGWLGLAHIGVIKAFLKHNIPIDYISGASFGSLVGGLYLALGDINKLEDFITSIGYTDLIKSISDVFSAGGIIKGEKIVQFLEEKIGPAKIEDLKTPFCAVASDLKTGRYVEISKGDLYRAIRTSGSLPVIFEPVKMNNMVLIDGGATNPVPVNVVKKMGADIAVGVSLYNGAFPIDDDLLDSNSSRVILQKTYDLHTYWLNLYCMKEADVSIKPNIKLESKKNMFEKFFRNREIIDIGEKEAEKMIPKIKKML